MSNLWLVFFLLLGCSSEKSYTSRKSIASNALLSDCQGYIDPMGVCQKTSGSCPEGQIYSQGNCSLDSTTSCPLDHYLNEKGQCIILSVGGVCEKGYVCAEDSCFSCILLSTACPVNTEFDESKKICVATDTQNKTLETQTYYSPIQCPNGTQLDGNLCVDMNMVCPEGTKKTTSGCIANVNCPEGSYSNYGTSCYKDPLCPSGSQPKNGQCVAENDQVLCLKENAVWKDGSCVMLQVQCPDGSSSHTGMCPSGNVECPEGTLLKDGSFCVYKDIVCKVGSLVDGVCLGEVVCPEGTLKSPEGCLVAGTCDPGFSQLSSDGTKCIPLNLSCPLGQIAFDGACVSLNPLCDLTSGYIANGICAMLPVCTSGTFDQDLQSCVIIPDCGPSGVCELQDICPDGSVPKDRKCLVQAPPLCPSGSSWNEERKLCVIQNFSCPQGFTKASGVCVANSFECPKNGSEEWTYYDSSSKKCLVKDEYLTCPCLTLGAIGQCKDGNVSSMTTVTTNGVKKCALPEESLKCPGGLKLLKKDASTYACVAEDNNVFCPDGTKPQNGFCPAPLQCQQGTELREIDGKFYCMLNMENEENFCPIQDTSIMKPQGSQCVLDTKFYQCPLSNMTFDPVQKRCLAGSDFTCPTNYQKSNGFCILNPQMATCPAGTVNVSSSSLDSNFSVLCQANPETVTCLNSGSAYDPQKGACVNKNFQCQTHATLSEKDGVSVCLGHLACPDGYELQGQVCKMLDSSRYTCMNGLYSLEKDSEDKQICRLNMEKMKLGSSSPKNVRGAVSSAICQGKKAFINRVCSQEDGSCFDLDSTDNFHKKILCQEFSIEGEALGQDIASQTTLVGEVADDHGMMLCPKNHVLVGFETSYDLPLLQNAGSKYAVGICAKLQDPYYVHAFGDNTQECYQFAASPGSVKEFLAPLSTSSDGLKEKVFAITSLCLKNCRRPLLLNESNGIIPPQGLTAYPSTGNFLLSTDQFASLEMTLYSTLFFRIGLFINPSMPFPLNPSMAAPYLFQSFSLSFNSINANFGFHDYDNGPRTGNFFGGTRYGASIDRVRYGFSDAQKARRWFDFLPSQSTGQVVEFCRLKACPLGNCGSDKY